MEGPQGGQVRRRKKRSSGGSASSGYLTGGPIGSSLTGLKRSNIRVVELVRRSTGYGFTISGQKPCLLRSIIEGSPAALAGLRKGHCLVGVNGKEVTHLAHDDVVQIIGKSTGFLRLHVADSYFSESSDDDALPQRLRNPKSIPLPLAGNPNRRVLRRDPSTNLVSYPTAIRRTKISPRRAVALGYCFPPTPPVKTVPAPSRIKPKQSSVPLYPSEDDDFKTDPNSMHEILGNERSEVLCTNQPQLGKKSLPSRCSLNAIKQRQRLSRVRLQPSAVGVSELEADVEIPQPLEVGVIVNSPRRRNTNEQRRYRRRSKGRLSPNSDDSEGHLNSSALYPPMHHLSVPISCARNGGSRSLDNLCSADFLDDDSGVSRQSCGKKLESKGIIGSSTPALNHEALQPIRDQFWEFKVPEAPKPNSEVSQAGNWAASIEKLLSDSIGTEIFTEYLEQEFSAENIYFYTACLQFKESYPNLTTSQRISVASTIFQKHLQNGATDPVNVDHQARNMVEKALGQPTLEMFDLPLSQIFNLLKFDCYPRFLKSETYRDYINGTISSRQSIDEPTDSDADSVKSQSNSKLNTDGRRKSLLPWNIKSRSKKKQRNKNEQGLSQDMSFIQKTCDESDQDGELRRQSCKVCRVVLPDNSTTVLPCPPGETLSVVIRKLLEKREFSYSAFEVISVLTGKAIDLNTQVSEITVREIKVEPRAFIGIELPLGWKVGIRANPVRKMAEVLKPILAQHSLKLDNIVIHDLETRQPVELKCPVGKLDGHHLSVETKGNFKSEEYTTHITEFPPSETHQFFDDDQLSAKTGSSHSSSVFKDFLRRSSKKYKRETPRVSHLTVRSRSTSENKIESTAIELAPDSIPKSKSSENYNKLTPYHSNGARTAERAVDKIESQPELPRRSGNAPSVGKNFTATNKFSSPLSLIRTELNLSENSRIRKPIYINQSNDKHNTA